MKAVVAIDSFKGSLSTTEAGNAVSDGIKAVYPDADVTVLPLADGGEGMVDAISAAKGGEFTEVLVHNPLGRIIQSRYGIDRASGTAIVEMASAAGITLLSDDERNPLYTTTYGVGEMIADAVFKGFRRFIIGIGGSATNDGGIGMLQALGFSFLDKNGNDVPRGAVGLRDVASIRTDSVMKELSNCSFCVACDVDNVLCGENGCSVVFGPQKGATPQMIKDMDAWLENYAELTRKVFPNADPNKPGTGAAGGLGFAFSAYLGAELKSGADIVIREIDLETHVKTADVVITGEGRLDGQTCMGKAPIAVAKVAKKHNKPVIAFSGCVADDAELCNEEGIDAFFPVVRKPCTFTEAMEHDTAYKNVCDTVQQVFRLIKTKI